jgi:phosphate transport system protein
MAGLRESDQPVDGELPHGEVSAAPVSVFHVSEQLRSLREETGSLAVEILVRYQPPVSEIRYVKSCVDIAYGLSRFGRYVYDIARTLRATSWTGWSTSLMRVVRPPLNGR